MTRPKNTAPPSFSSCLCSSLVLLTLACTTACAADGDAPPQQSLTPGMRVRILAPDNSPGKVIGTISKLSFIHP
jgi:hypothetical protein